MRLFLFQSNPLFKPPFTQKTQRFTFQKQAFFIFVKNMAHEPISRRLDKKTFFRIQ